MKEFTFTTLAPKARMQAVISFREHLEQELAASSATLDEARKLTLLPVEQQAKNLKEMIAVAEKVRNGMLKRAGSMDDDITCIEYLQKDTMLFNEEGKFLRIK